MYTTALNIFVLEHFKRVSYTEHVPWSLGLSCGAKLLDRRKDPLIVAPDVLESFLEFFEALLLFELG